jgi:predicted HicB family RNase H-like nuclease
MPTSASKSKLINSELAEFSFDIIQTYTLCNSFYRTLKVLNVMCAHNTKKSKKTTLRTVRLSQELDDILQNISAERHISLNTLVALILTKFVEWDRFAEEFDLVSIQRKILRSIMEGTAENKLESIATKYGSELPREGMMFWFKEVNQGTFVSGLSNIFKYGNLAKLQVDTKNGEHLMVAQHDLGLAGSKFLKNFISAASTSTLGQIPEFDLTPNSILIKLPTRTITNS